MSFSTARARAARFHTFAALLFAAIATAQQPPAPPTCTARHGATGGSVAQGRVRIRIPRDALTRGRAGGDRNGRRQYIRSRVARLPDRSSRARSFRAADYQLGCRGMRHAHGGLLRACDRWHVIHILNESFSCGMGGPDGRSFFRPRFEAPKGPHEWLTRARPSWPRSNSTGLRHHRHRAPRLHSAPSASSFIRSIRAPDESSHLTFLVTRFPRSGGDGCRAAVDWPHHEDRHQSVFRENERGRAGSCHSAAQDCSPRPAEPMATTRVRSPAIENTWLQAAPKRILITPNDSKASCRPFARPGKGRDGRRTG